MTGGDRELDTSPALWRVPSPVESTVQVDPRSIRSGVVCKVGRASVRLRTGNKEPEEGWRPSRVTDGLDEEPSSEGLKIPGSFVLPCLGNNDVTARRRSWYAKGLSTPPGTRPVGEVTRDPLLPSPSVEM